MSALIRPFTPGISTNTNFSIGAPLSLVSICLDKDTRKALKLFVESMPSVRQRLDLDDYRIDYNDSIQNWIGDPPPDICLVDFDKAPSDAVLTTERIHASTPETTIFAVSSGIQSDLIIQAMRSGCSEYLTKPLDEGKLLEAIRRVGDRNGDKKEISKAEMMSFIGAKGGCGVTTILTQLGAQLAGGNSMKALVFDLHANFGDAALYLGLTKHRYHCVELIENTDRLDAELLQSFVIHHSSGLDVVPAPEELLLSQKISSRAMIQTFDFLRLRYDYILVDLPPKLDEQNLECLCNSNHIYIVTVPEASALRNVSRYLDCLTKREIPQERIHVVVNRHQKRDLITDEQIEAVIRQKIFWKIPNQYPEVVNSISGGDSISHLSGSKIMLSLKEFAEAIGAKPQTENNEKESLRVPGFWGRLKCASLF
jgi:pilus assembly protein CpaE